MASLDRRIAALSGSDDASDIAELRKLQAEKQELQEGINDTYYNHAKDQQNQALDDELEAYQTAKEDYLETLRDALEQTEEIINEKIQEVLLNADIVLTEINTTAGEYGITLSGSLKQPWIDASETALSFKTALDTNLPLLTNEDGVITLFSVDAKQKLEGVFTTGGSAARAFESSVQSVVSNIKTVIQNSTSPFTNNLKFPWDQTIAKDGPISTFSSKAQTAINTALTTAQNKANSMLSSLKSPWVTSAVNTWSQNVTNKLSAAVSAAQEAGRKISEALNVEVPSYTGGNSNDNTGKTNPPEEPEIKTPKSYKVTGYLHSLGLKATDGASTLKEAKQRVENMLALQFYREYRKLGHDDVKIQKFWDNTYKTRIVFESTPQYAKGTTGTPKDEWAITDEPWLGNELTMYATPQGTLSYMRAGSTVVPADLTKEIIGMAEIGTDGLLDATKHGTNINMISNAVNKPELNLSFDSLLHVDNCTEEVLPQVQKLINKNLEDFTRKMNYSLRKIGAT